jgi:hypothetical protein
MIHSTYHARMLANEHDNDLRGAAEAHHRALQVALRRVSWGRLVLNRLGGPARRGEPGLAPRWEEQ